MPEKSQKGREVKVYEAVEKIIILLPGENNTKSTFIFKDYENIAQIIL